MFYLSNSSVADAARRETAAMCRATSRRRLRKVVRTRCDLWVQHLTAFCSLLHQRCYVGSQFRPFLPPSRSISNASVITSPSRFPVANKSRWNFHPRPSFFSLFPRGARPSKSLFRRKDQPLATKPSEQRATDIISWQIEIQRIVAILLSIFIMIGR